MNYLLHILILINIYLILALSLNLVVGYTGLLSLSHASFYGIGAYVSTLLIVDLGVPFIPALVLAIFGAAILSLLISIPALRLRGDYFVLASLGFQIIAFNILYNWVELTRGSFGIAGIPRPAFFGFEISSLFAYFLFTGIIALICVGLLYLVGNSPFGRTLKSIREDELAAATLGKNITRFKMKAFAVAAGFAAVSGVLLAGYTRYIDPTIFIVNESIFILSAIIIGGTGNISGPVIGAVLMVLLPEGLRFLGMPDSIAANMRQVIYGLLIIVIMRYQPQGLAGEYKFE